MTEPRRRNGVVVPIDGPEVHRGTAEHALGALPKALWGLKQPYSRLFLKFG